MEHEGDGDTSCGWCTWDNSKRLVKGTRRLGNTRTSGDHLKYNIIKIDKNTEKSPGELRRRAVTQTPVRIHQLMLVWKTLKGDNNNNNKKKKKKKRKKKKIPCYQVDFAITMH